MVTQIEDHGQIKRLALPDEWQETILPEPESHSFSLREFSPEDDESVRLCLYYRGYPFDEKSGSAFTSIVNASPHILSATEIRSISDILDDISQPTIFKPLAIHTQVIKGKSLLLVEGRWLSQEWDTYSMYIPADESGCVVQQVYLLAPVASFPRRNKEFKDCLKSIEWS